MVIYIKLCLNYQQSQSQNQDIGINIVLKMISKSINYINFNFRTRLKFDKYFQVSQMKSVTKIADNINWFPGHMRKALRNIQENSKNVDVFLQIRDARIPYSSKNSEFDHIIKRNQKKKHIIFNKFDLCDQIKTKKIIDDYQEYGIKCFSVSTKNHEDMRKIIGVLRENYDRKYEKVGLWLAICGMPNVGKSTIINQVRMISDLQNKTGAAKATASVATTKGLRGFKILQNPLMFLVDSPGVMVPSNILPQLGLKMAVVGLIKQTIVDKMVLVQFIMEWFQKQKNTKYYTNLRVQKPSNASQYLQSIRRRYKLYDYDAALDKILLSLREGEMGPMTFDDPIQID